MDGVDDLLWLHYKDGHRSMSMGWAFEPPDNVLLRRAFVAGWQDFINNHYPDKDEFLRTFAVDESSDTREVLGPIVRPDAG